MSVLVASETQGRSRASYSEPINSINTTSGPLVLLLLNAT